MLPARVNFNIASFQQEHEPSVMLRRGLLLLRDGHGGPVVAVPKQDEVVQGRDRGQHLLDERKNLGTEGTVILQCLWTQQHQGSLARW